jgi:hypothetical protein
VGNLPHRKPPVFGFRVGKAQNFTVRMKNQVNRHLLRFLAAAFSSAIVCDTFAVDPRAYAVELSAEVQAAPAQITLKWTGDGNATGYSVFRKAPSASSWTAQTTLAANAAAWTDVSVANGGSYEYAVTKTTSAGYAGTGYMFAGINATLVENRGKLILLVDNSFSSSLSAELGRLQQDLVGDGWTVIRHDVSRNDSVVTVKNLIKADYNADPGNVKSVFLFGHVPVPYSGDNNPPPDGHPDHQGAWPADAYYGDMNGVWTDSSVNNTSGTARSTLQNVPGDGKFDQTDLPSDVDLQVGRVDLANMTCFANKTPARNELDLLRAYLNKDHNFRVGAISVPRRGLVRDTFGDIYGENFASSGWRNSSAFFGPQNSVAVDYDQYIPTLRDNGYLWSYGAGGGTFTTCSGIGSSDDFALNDVKTVFAGFIGSYFGDWDSESSFLRAPLGSGTCLAVVWDGRPHWFLHHMALGETIGYSTRVSQNNVGGGLYSTQNWGTHRVHIALMGDPTLRLHPVIPPSNVSASASAGVTLNWSPSPDTAIQGYAVYRGSSVNGPFTRISGGSLLSTLGMTDPGGAAGSVYMVRAVKLEQSASGTYYNPSVGAFVTASAPIILAPSAPSNLSGSPVSSTSIRLQWSDNSANESGFNLMRKVGVSGSYAKIAVGANSTSLTETGLSAATQYFYKVSAWNGGGESTFSTEISVNTPANLVNGAFLGSDSSTGGTWKGVYGSEGYNIIGDRASYSTPVTVTPSGQTQWIWNWAPTDPAALQRASDGTRIASCWYSFTTMNVALNFSSSTHHKLTVYCLDWDAAGRSEVVEIVDANQNVLQSRTVSGFQKGVYLSFDVTGAVTLRVRAVTGTAVISGIFIDPLPLALSQVATPSFLPGSGTFSSGQKISISCATTGAAIRYTTDGSAPNSGSPLYTGPLTLSLSSVLSARAFVSGMADSAVASASFTVQSSSTSSAKVSFVGIDTTRQGTWKGVLGTEAYSIPADVQVAPSYITIGATGKSEWTWVYSTTDARGVQRPNLANRLASCAYNSSFQYDLNFTDGKTHSLALYCLDWDRANRSQLIEILDYDSKAVLHSYTLSSFAGGTYLNYALKGHVAVRVTGKSGPNAVVSGLFVDPSATQL